MSDTITVYYYTAWDGFAWQGCDAATARSLQGYMEATKTLPKTAADKPPFGGAVTCKISGQIGVAFYRYLTRKNGDLSGRDSLYIALAFVPLSCVAIEKDECIDFAKLLEQPELADPNRKVGELGWETISVSERGLRLKSVGDVLDDWLTEDVVDKKYSKGLDSLRKLSSLFFSEYSQLGFLNAVFNLEAGKVGIENISATLTYEVYPVVKNVVAASKALGLARKSYGGVLERNHETVRDMEEALNKLYDWSKKQPDYKGLDKFYEAKKLEASDDAERVKQITEYSKNLTEAYDRIKNVNPSNNIIDEHSKDDAERCVEEARRIIKIPVLNDISYNNVLKRSIDAIQHAAEILGLSKGLAQVAGVAAEKKRTEEELKKANSELGRKKEENQDLSKQVDSLTAELKALKAGLCKKGKPTDERAVAQTQCDMKSLSSNVIQQTSRTGRKRWAWMPSGVMDWCLNIVIGIMLVLTAVILTLIIRRAFFANHEGYQGVQYPGEQPSVEGRLSKAETNLSQVVVGREDVETHNGGTNTVMRKATDKHAQPDNEGEAKVLPPSNGKEDKSAKHAKDDEKQPEGDKQEYPKQHKRSKSGDADEHDAASGKKGKK